MHEELIEWGKWARNNPDKLSYKSQWYEMIMRGNVPMPSKGYLMNDDRGLQIDEAVTKLARYSLLQYQIFCFYYLCGMSERTIADKMDKRIIPRNRRNRVKQELDKAGAFIAGCLTG